jgi:DNA invertase Pin-like site-specific DNA recombinase
LIIADGYLRLSDARSENGSFVEREAALRKRAEQLNWTIRRIVIENDEIGSRSASAFKRRKVLLSDGTTAMRVVRPGFRSILDDLASGRVTALLAEDLDRTMRDPRDAQDLLDVIRECKGHADSLSGSLKLTAGGTDAERLMTEIMVSVARKSSADTSRRVTDHRARKAAKGEFGGGARAYGFESDGITVRQAEAAVLVKMADDALADVKLRSIARDLNERGVSTATGVPWTAELVWSVLIRPRNAGILVHRGEEAGPAPWPALIPEQTWRGVVAKLTDPRRRTGPGPAPKWLLSGLALCAGCGSTLQYGAARGVYRCRRALAGCTAINATGLDAYVVGVIVARMQQPDAADLISEPVAGVDPAALHVEAVTLRSDLTKLADAHGKNAFTMAEWLAARAPKAARLAVVEAEMSAAASKSPLAPLAAADDVHGVWEGLTLGVQRACAAKLFSGIVVSAVRRGRFDDDAVRLVPAAEQQG